jgi:formyltetrahydrofolate hydrolase
MYLIVLKEVLRKGGYAIIAAFSLKGAKMCSGLDVKSYDQKMLAEFLGKDFKLPEYFDYTYYMPSGDPRPYIFILYSKEIHCLIDILKAYTLSSYIQMIFIIDMG